MIVDLITKNYTINYKVITEVILKQLTDLFAKINEETKKELHDDKIEILYVIREGNISYSGPTFGEFNTNFKVHKKADYIQIIFQSLSPKSQAPNRRITLTIDKNTNNNMEVLGNNENWVKGVFDRFEDIFENQPNANVVLHSPYFEMGIQVLGAFSITVLAIYLSNIINRFTTFEHSSIYLFIVIFIIFSNIWTYVGKSLIHLRNTYYPKVDIREKVRKPILISVISFIVLVLTTWCINYLLDLIFKK